MEVDELVGQEAELVEGVAADREAGVTDWAPLEVVGWVARQAVVARVMVTPVVMVVVAGALAARAEVRVPRPPLHVDDK